ncbi:MAG: ATP-binding protein [Kiloniellaceae bacterium]
MITSNPEALLNRLLREPVETGWLEFKENNEDPERIGKLISACANSAMLEGKERAFLVWGITDKTKEKVGTKVTLGKIKKGGENFSNWISRKIDPKLMMEFLDFECDGKFFSILTIEPTYDRPVRFDGVEYVRIGENVKKLADFPEHQRALWLATARHKFEDAVAAPHQTTTEIFEKLDTKCFYDLAAEPMPMNNDEIVSRFIKLGFIKEDMEGGYDITNLAAILLARDVTEFPSISGKSIRVITYEGRDKRKSKGEVEGGKGYAVGFSGLMTFIMEKIPKEERYINGIRRNQPTYPETALREVIANALIHQDFTISGAGPVIELYEDRIEVSNPGNSLIEADRMIDERRSRNEKLAATMRSLGLCEERGGGLDKTIIEIEQNYLPAPSFVSSENSMRVVLFGPKEFSDLSKQEKQRACFYHCVLRWLSNDYMNNSSLRERFGLPQDQYQAVSAIISEAVSQGRIAPADPKQGNRYARYIPYWAKP